MSYEREYELEDKLIEQLCAQGYDKVVISDEKALYENLRNQLFLHNKEKLNGVPFTDKEFERVLAYLEGKSVFESAKRLRGKFILERESGEKVYIDFLNQKYWCKNKYQVTHQTTVLGKYENRYDVTILVNGLPLVQIELKRRGLDMKEAFNQICRYKRQSYTGLYRYIQIFVISNGVDSKYFANSDQELLYSQTFFWSDEENNRITRLSEFADSFLEKCFVSEIISRYMIINETTKSLMVMRPYQIYAVKEALERVIGTNKNGYIWHTTGSGKTLTSFKLSQVLSQYPGISKVFFLVDRKDLDNQTLSEFNKFEKDSVNSTDDTKTLVKQIKDINTHLIVTTIQKMAHAIKSPKYSNILNEFKDHKVVFIIDECHRSQFGEMHTLINKHFEYAQYIGFTGTPRFIENRSNDGRVTADIFGNCLHTYLIKDAIKDGNVLGFSVDYIKTIKDELDENDKTKVEAIDTDEIFLSEERINKIVTHILENHDRKTQNRKYTAMLTVQSIPMLVKYYDIFKERNHDLKITGIFTYGQNEDCEGRDELSRESLERIITDYNEIYDTKFSTNTFAGYFTDVSKKVKNAEIDILIVVNMFLTGFDSKTLNTLYIDKNLKYHDLLQAYSRTNRVEKTNKSHGNIVCYRNLRENTEEAIKLFSKTNSTDVVLMKSYDEYLKEFRKNLEKLKEMALTADDVDKIEGESNQYKFIVRFRELARTLNSLKTFCEFEFTKEVTGISEQEYEDFKGKYSNIYNETKRGVEKVSVLNDIDFEIELICTDKINVDYILKLIANIDLTNPGDIKRKTRKISEELDKTGDESLRLKKDLLKDFLDKVIPKLNPTDNIPEELDSYLEEAKNKEINKFANEINLESIDIKKLIAEQEFSGFINNESLQEVTKGKVSGGLKEKRKIKNKIKDFISNHIKKFNY